MPTTRRPVKKGASLRRPVVSATKSKAIPPLVPAAMPDRLDLLRLSEAASLVRMHKDTLRKKIAGVPGVLKIPRGNGTVQLMIPRAVFAAWLQTMGLVPMEAHHG